MWQVQAFIDHQWQPVSLSGIKPDFKTEEEANRVLEAMYPQQVANQKAGGTVLVRVEKLPCQET